MGSSLPQAQTRPVSWKALEKVEPFTEAVKKQLESLKSKQRVKIFPNQPLSGEKLDKVIRCIWCVCDGGLQWRAVCLLSGMPFGTVYSCFFRWSRLGLWKDLLIDLFRRWRGACGGGPAAGGLRRHSGAVGRHSRQSVMSLLFDVWKTRH
jgi:hypothetical protein